MHCHLSLAVACSLYPLQFFDMKQPSDCISDKVAKLSKIVQKTSLFWFQICLGGPQKLLLLTLLSNKVWLALTFVDLRVLGLG